MSLDFYLTGIADWQELVEHRDGEPLPHRPLGLTTGMIWMCPMVGIGQINAKTAEEWFIRCHMWESTTGAMLSRPNDETGTTDPRPITWADVQRHMGLRTNVFGHNGPVVETRAQNAKRLMEHIQEDAQRALKLGQEEYLSGKRVD